MLDKSEVAFGATRRRTPGQSVMSNAGRRTRLMTRGSGLVLGLLVVLAFLGHDVIMATPHPALAAENPTLALTVNALQPHASTPVSHGCDIGRPAVLKAPDALPRQSTTAVIVVHPIVVRPAGRPSYAAATQARSPTAQRAVLQVFRI